MPTVFTHAALALAAADVYARDTSRGRLAVSAVLVSTLPDLDVAGFALGIRYGDLLGHRGLSHSLPFALLLATGVLGIGFGSVPRLSRRWWSLLGFFALVAGSHGLLDAFTDGGLGSALLAPFSSARWFAPWQPIPVSPLGLHGFLSAQGWEVLRFELLWLWLPAIALATAVRLARRERPRGSRPATGA